MKNTAHSFNCQWLVTGYNELLLSLSLLPQQGTQEGRVHDFRIPSLCKSIFSPTYSSTFVRSLRSSLPFFLGLDHHTYPCYTYRFPFPLFRSLANKSINKTKPGIVQNGLFCLNSPFRSIWVLITTLFSLLPIGTLYLEEKVLLPSLSYTGISGIW